MYEPKTYPAQSLTNNKTVGFRRPIEILHLVTDSVLEVPKVHYELLKRFRTNHKLF